MGTVFSEWTEGGKSAIPGRKRPFRQSKKRVREIKFDKESSTTEGQPSPGCYLMAGRALPPISYSEVSSRGQESSISRETSLLALDSISVCSRSSNIEDIYNDPDADEDDYIPGQFSAETQPKTLLPTVGNLSTRSQGAPVAHVLNSAPVSAGVMSVNPEVWRRQENPRDLGESKALACLVYVICHELHSKMLLKLTTVFIEYDCLKQQQELREKVGRMEFGKQVHEDCHYLYAAHKEDVSVKVSGLRGGWKTENGCYDNIFVKVFRYRKLWDGIMCITSTHFETPVGSRPELFGATFKIQQDGLLEEATTFDVCEPTVKIIAKADLKPDKNRLHDTAIDDDKSYEVTSSSGSSNDTEVTMGSLT